MVEMSQVRAEEAKWTPKSVYDILPPSSLRFDGFDYLEGEDGVDREKANKSLLEGFADWFKNLIGITGRIIGGAIELGVGVFKAVADGIQNFLGGIGRIFKAIFGDGPPPPEPIFSPIHADLEAAVRPHLDLIKKNSKEVSESIEKIDTLQMEMQGVLGEVATIREDTAKAIDDASAALVEAEAATAHAESLNSERVAAEELIRKTVAEALAAANSAKASADSKSTNFYGPTAPTTAKDGDTWFKSDPNTGKSVIYQRVDGAWVKNLDAAEIYDALAAVDTEKFDAAMKQLNQDLAALDNDLDAANAVLAQKVDTAKFDASMAQLNKDLDAAETALSSTQMDLARKINKGEVQASDIVAGAVVAGKIASGAVSTDNLAADAVTAGKVAANAITGREVAANSIYANHLVVAQPGNLIANGDFSSGIEPWTGPITSVRGGGGTPNGLYGNLVSGYTSGNFHGTDSWFLVEPGASYAFECWLYADTPGSVFFLQLLNQKDVPAGTAGEVVNPGDASTGAGAHLVNGPTLPTGWTKYSCVYKMHADTTKARLGVFWFNHPNGVQTGRQAIGGVSLRPMADASLIVDGSIQAKHIVAGSITSKEIGAGVITAKNIGAGEITAKEIASNSITTSHLTITPGNLFPDPHFQDDCWNSASPNVARNKTENGGQLTLLGSGSQTGLYYQPAGLIDKSMIVEPGAAYRLNMTAHASNVDISTPSVYMRYARSSDGAIRTSLLGAVSGGAGTRQHELMFTAPTDMRDGSCTIGFFIKASMTTGTVTMWNVQVQRAADANLIVDGAILARHIQAGSIGTDHLEANAVKAGNIDSNAIVARHIQADALSAREIKAEVFTQVGTNVIPLLPGTTVGAWTKNADGTALNPTLGAGESGRYWIFSGTRQPGSLNMVAVDPNIEYDFEVWLNGENMSKLYVELRDQDGNHAVASGGLTNNAYLVSPDNGGVVRQTSTTYLIDNFTLRTGWRKYKTRITLRPDSKFVMVGAIYGSHPNGPAGRAFIGGMSLTPHIIPQAEIDALQNEAIKKNTLVGSKNIKAIDGLLQGIEGLERANVLQDQINQEQARINRRFQENDDTFLAIQRENMKVISRTIAATGREIIYNNHMSLDPGNGKVTFKPGWFGECIISWEEEDDKLDDTNRFVSIARFSWKGSSEYVWSRSSSSLRYRHGTRWLRVDYQVEPGVQKSVNMTNTNVLMTAGRASSWTTMSQFTATTETGHYIEYRLTLKAANRGTQYGIRFLVNGSEKAVFWDGRVGPLTHLGNGEVPISLAKYVSDIKKGDKIEIQTYVASTNGAWDECFDQFGRITYIDQEG